MHRRDGVHSLSDDQEMVVQDVRILIGEYEAHCVRCA
jgi:hypothetical protein